mmetsp:Transcript_50735/g.149580  ORF Transcript_50735/g.149580 Transcript_50735/m.149580 type:complete len:221 (+) Transcript_50735:72-734(+)
MGRRDQQPLARVARKAQQHHQKRAVRGARAPHRVSDVDGGVGSELEDGAAPRDHAAVGGRHAWPLAPQRRVASTVERATPVLVVPVALGERHHVTRLLLDLRPQPVTPHVPRERRGVARFDGRTPCGREQRIGPRRPAPVHKVSRLRVALVEALGKRRTLLLGDTGTVQEPRLHVRSVRVGKDVPVKHAERCRSDALQHPHALLQLLKPQLERRLLLRTA